MPTDATSATYFFITDQRCIDRTWAALPEVAASSATEPMKRLSWVRKRR